MIVNANNQVRTFFPARIFDFDISATTFCKVEKILKGRRDSIPSPSKSCEHLIFFFGKTLLGIVNKLFSHKMFVDIAKQCLAKKSKNKKFKCSQQLLEGDGIKSRLPFKIFFTLV